MRKLCPFCGKKPKIIKYKAYLEDSPFIIICCPMINYDRAYKSKYLAEKAWGKRAC